MNNKVKVIKKAERKSDEVYQREHELGLLHLLARKYPQEVSKLAKKDCCKPQYIVV